MKWLRRYNESQIVVANNNDIKLLVRSEIIDNGRDCDLNHIDVFSVTDMSYLFYHILFNGDISKWKVNNVKNMTAMFQSCPFNGDISKWNVSSVDSASYMFYHSLFNGDISRWNMCNLSDLFDLDTMFIGSPLEGREPIWYHMIKIFSESDLLMPMDSSSIFDSIEEWKWIDFDKKIIWKTRLKKVLYDWGMKWDNIPDELFGYKVL